MVTKKEIPIFFFLLLLIPLISATDTFGIFEKDKDVELLQVCSNSTSICDYCNISSIKYPNSSVILSDLAMNKRTAEFNYTLISNYTIVNGDYVVSGFCGAADGIEIWTYSFEITPNGKDKPTAGVVVLFIILFLIIVTGLLSLIIYNIARMAEWNFDVKDLIFNISAYFALFVVYIFGKEYLGNSFVDGFLEWTIASTAVSNVIIPIVAFIMSYFKGNIYGGKHE